MALTGEFFGEVNNTPDLLDRYVPGLSVRNPSLFALVWNKLSTRTTSIPDDLHGLLAVLLGLSAQEILGLRPRTFEGEQAKGELQDPQALPQRSTRTAAERMTFIYRAQSLLPLSILFTPFPLNAPMCNGNEWMPRFPAGSLRGDFGWMNWGAQEKDLASGLQILAHGQNLLGLTTECSIQTLEDGLFSLPSSFFSRHAAPTDEDWKSVNFYPPGSDVISRVPEGSSICILFHRGRKQGSSITVGSHRPLRLNFICPLTLPGMAFNEISFSLEEAETALMTCLPRTHLLANQIFTLNCRKAIK